MSVAVASAAAFLYAGDWLRVAAVGTSRLMHNHTLFSHVPSCPFDRRGHGISSSPPSTLAPPIHYTQQPSRLAASSGTACICVHGGGFVTREMLERTIDELQQELRAAASSGELASGVLVDLREVAGYETSCLMPALQFLAYYKSMAVGQDPDRPHNLHYHVEVEPGQEGAS